MQSKFFETQIEKLFYLLKKGDLDQFRRELTHDNVNTVYYVKATEYLPHNYGTIKRYQAQDNYLVHEAIEQDDADALRIILENGGDLLLRNKHITRTLVESAQRWQEVTSVSATALEYVAASTHGKLKQCVFDHISQSRALYEKDVYRQFIMDKLRFADLKNFNPKCLQIEPNMRLPISFNSTLELKQFLQENDVVVAGIYFTENDYFQILSDASQIVSEAMLKHALNVCRFSNDQLRQIYNALSEESLKTIVFDHDPDVDPARLAELLELIAKSEAQVQQRPSSRAPTPQAAITPLRGLTPQLRDFYRNRGEVVRAKIINLRSQLEVIPKTAKKRRQDVETELGRATKNLKECEDALRDDEALHEESGMRLMN